jgi:hemolysin activation/secretion protein
VRLASAALIAAACFLPARALAQTPPPAFDAAAQAAERQQREEQDRQREQLRRERESVRPGAVSDEAPLPKIKAPAIARRDIRQLVITGADHMRPAFREQLRAQIEGRSIGVEDVERLLTDITRHYISRGYVTTRAYIPDQDLATGTLRVLVVEGKLEELKTAGVSRNIFPVSRGELLNLRDLEQGIDNLNRLPSHQATLDLLPGAEAGGTVVGVRDVRSRPWRLNVSADNTGSESTGRYQASATVGLDDLTGFGEAITLSHRSAVPYRPGRKASQATMGSVSVPWGYQTVTVGGSVSSYAMLFAAPSGQDLPFDGDSWSLYARTDRVLYRGQTGRLSAYANLTWKASRNYLMGKLIGVSSRDSVVADLGANYSTVLAGGFVAVDASVSQGLPIFGALEDVDGPRATTVRNQFTAFKFNVSWMRSFRLREMPFSFSTSLNGQWTPQVLYGSDQLTIGGVYAVRGFDRTNLAGDRGYVWRNEISTTLPFLKSKDGAPRGTLRPYVGVDHGYAGSNLYGKTPQGLQYAGPSGVLVGGTVGVAVTFGRYNADVSYASSLHHAGGMLRESGRLYFRLNASF